MLNVLNYISNHTRIINLIATTKTNDIVEGKLRLLVNNSEVAEEKSGSGNGITSGRI